MWSQRQLMRGRRWIWRGVELRIRDTGREPSTLRVVNRDATFVDYVAVGTSGWQVGGRQVCVPGGAIKVVLAPGDGSEIRQVTW